MTIYQTYRHPDGDTLSLGGTVALPAGTWSATSSLRTSTGELVFDFAVALAPIAGDIPAGAPTHTILITKSATDMATLDQNPYYADVRYENSDGVVIHSPTFIIQNVSSQTPPPTPP